MLWEPNDASTQNFDSDFQCLRISELLVDQTIAELGVFKVCK